MDINIPLLFVLSLFAALLPASLGFKCYVCSWSPNDATNRTDMCSSGNFRRNEVLVHNECEAGCEIFIAWDNNGILEQARRNCMDKETQLTGDCVSEENKAHSWKRCTCANDLCNSARSNNPVFWFSTILVLSVLIQIIRGHIQ